MWFDIGMTIHKNLSCHSYLFGCFLKQLVLLFFGVENSMDGCGCTAAAYSYKNYNFEVRHAGDSYTVHNVHQ